MKRFLYLLLGGLFVALILSGVPTEKKTHAESLLDLQLEKKISTDILQKVLEGKLFESVRVVIQPAGHSDALLDLAIGLLGGSDIDKLDNLRIRVANMQVHNVVTLALRTDVSYVSLSRDARPMGHLSLTTGTDQIRNSAGQTNDKLDGTGVAIAVLDSGIDTGHHSFLNRSNKVRVVCSRDFTGEGRTDDPYGHGTHVASLAAGNGRISNAQYIG